MTIPWRMRIACLITKVTDTHIEYIIFIAFPLQQWLRERASIYVTRTVLALFWYSSHKRQVRKKNMYFSPCGMKIIRMRDGVRNSTTCQTWCSSWWSWRSQHGPAPPDFWRMECQTPLPTSNGVEHHYRYMKGEILVNNCSRYLCTLPGKSFSKCVTKARRSLCRVHSPTNALLLI